MKAPIAMPTMYEQIEGARAIFDVIAAARKYARLIECGAMTKDQAAAALKREADDLLAENLRRVGRPNLKVVRESGPASVA